MERARWTFMQNYCVNRNETVCRLGWKAFGAFEGPICAIVHWILRETLNCYL